VKVTEMSKNVLDISVTHQNCFSKAVSQNVVDTSWPYLKLVLLYVTTLRQVS
jgi:hypothetical protein